MRATIKYQVVIIATVLVAILLQFCAKDPYPVDITSGYPSDVGQILQGKCATSGCHNEQSSHACAGLNLTSWETLFEGGRNNACVIPFRPDQSYLLFSINTFPDLGPMLLPTMPVNHQPLSREEVLQIRDWIAIGAPNRDGEVKFSGNPVRSKIYVLNQGCDMVTVFDAETKLAMRCVDVGRSGFAIEAPHDIHVSPDGQFWYVTFFAGTLLQKYSTVTDQLVGELDLGTSSWHSMCISNDSRFAALSHWDSQGKVAYVNLETMSLIQMWQGFSYPHGCAFDASGTSLYIVSQMGNFFYKLDITDPQNPGVDMIPVVTNAQTTTFGAQQPYVIQFAPGNQTFFIPCQGTNEIRVFSAANDSLLAVIPSSGVPQLLGFSETTPYAFVTCMIDTTNAATRSSVDILNWNNGTWVKTVYPGFQERGLAVDDRNGVVYVGNRNVDAGGPAPHHTTACAGRNGDISIISIPLLEVDRSWKAEVTVDPYALTIRK